MRYIIGYYSFQHTQFLRVLYNYDDSYPACAFAWKWVRSKVLSLSYAGRQRAPGSARTFQVVHYVLNHVLHHVLPEMLSNPQWSGSTSYEIYAAQPLTSP